MTVPDPMSVTSLKHLLTLTRRRVVASCSRNVAITRLSTMVNNEFNLDKEQYYRSAFHDSNGDARKTWQMINELKSSSTVKQIKLNNSNIFYPHELSSDFNDYF